MAADINDKFTEATNGTRPVPTTLTSLKSIGAASISCGALTGWPTATAVHFIIYTTDVNGNKVAGSQTDWKGIVSGTTITNLTLKAGTDNGYSVGAVVEAAPTAAWADDLTEGIRVEHKQDGTHSDITADSVTVSGNIEATGTIEASEFIITGAGGDNGWSTGLPTPDTVTNNGNRSYNLVFNSTDLTDTVSEGMRLRTTRTVSAPTQCADLEASSSQYFSSASAGLAGVTFVDDFTCSAWIKLESYTAGNQMIISRVNAGFTQGWFFTVNSAGRLRIWGGTTGGGTDRAFISYQSVPLNKWVHVAASLDMSGNSGLIYMDGVLVPSVSDGGTSTALIQAGDLVVGNSTSGTGYFDGKLAQVAVFSSVLSAATIRSYMSQGLAGNESTLVSAFSCNNSLLDLNTTNNNDLTANGGALATNVDSPFGNYLGGTLDYAIITKTAFSTNTTLTVQVPEGCTIPTSGGVSAVAYSTQEAPYGMPTSEYQWEIGTLQRTNSASNALTTTVVANVNSFYLNTPVGAWELRAEGNVQVNTTGANAIEARAGISTATTTFSESCNFITVSSSVTYIVGAYASSVLVKPTSATTYYLNVSGSGTGTLTGGHRGEQGNCRLYAKFGLL